jgi:hypothetical protein
MVPVKLECDCGQHYAFDVEPVNGLMPSNIACPGCGVDGTPAANQSIAQTLAASPVIIPPAPGAGLRLFASEPAAPAAAAAATLPRGALHASQFGLVDRNQAEVEARAKVSWGDPPDAVIKYLMIQGFTHAEASGLVDEMFKVRAAETRANGVKKILIGFGMMCVPVVALLMHVQMISLKLMGGAIGVGLWGIFVLIQGAIMVIAPKMETGDVAEQ